MYTSRCVFVYNNTRDYISVRRVCKHVPVGRNMRHCVAAPIEAIRLRNVGPGDRRGAWHRLAVRARVAVRGTIMGCADISGSPSHIPGVFP